LLVPGESLWNYRKHTAFFFTCRKPPIQRVEALKEAVYGFVYFIIYTCW